MDLVHLTAEFVFPAHSEPLLSEIEPMLEQLDRRFGPLPVEVDDNTAEDEKLLRVWVSLPPDGKHGRNLSNYEQCRISDENFRALFILEELRRLVPELTDTFPDLDELRQQLIGAGVLQIH